MFLSTGQVYGRGIFAAPDMEPDMELGMERDMELGMERDMELRMELGMELDMEAGMEAVICVGCLAPSAIPALRKFLC